MTSVRYPFYFVRVLIHYNEVVAVNACQTPIHHDCISIDGVETTAIDVLVEGDFKPADKLNASHKDGVVTIDGETIVAQAPKGECWPNLAAVYADEGGAFEGEDRLIELYRIMKEGSEHEGKVARCLGADHAAYYGIRPRNPILAAADEAWRVSYHEWHGVNPPDWDDIRNKRRQVADKRRALCSQGKQDVDLPLPERERCEAMEALLDQAIKQFDSEDSG